ncbi:LacI family DNA-binding transcriptional regulator [Marvinbryantia formatexigens]|nr:LacI family DNA-binding transcriptional regulator [Marvinbryantia formatexigens]UWO22976.1 LacI family DNA-binding transcriptional regulator [Marvinbryantia formatexigens DSM 14469]SDG34018.1 transcriptional regulator, LacI family [Marvinbryantia formatexigens]
MEKVVKLKDIADRLQVSVVTVSNALAGRSGVSEELRSRIEQTAQELGYQKKPRREKKQAKQRTLRPGLRIGVVIPKEYVTKYASFYWELYQRVAMEASRMGCFVLLEIVERGENGSSRLPLLLQGDQIDGLIALGIQERFYLAELYRKAACPMLMLDSNFDEIPCDAVISNSFYGMYQVTNYLIRQGHTRLAFVGERLATGSIMDRYQGYSKALLEHGIRERADWIIADRDSVTRDTILQLPQELPTAFVCNSDYTAELLAHLLVKENLRIPEDISLAGYDDFLAGGILQGRLTTYAVDMDAMAHESLKLLMKRMKERGREKMVRTVDGKLIIRESVQNVKGER